MNKERKEQRTRQARAIWERKDTEELLAVWKKNDRTEWTDDVFEVIREILTARVGDLPAQQEYTGDDARAATPSGLSRIALFVGAHKTLFRLVAILGLTLLCRYAFVRLVWINSECGMRPHSLVWPVSIQKAEATHTVNGVPFGYQNEEWESLKDQKIFLDVLWYYEDHGLLWGTDGYVLVRLGVPVDCVVLRMY